MKFQFFASAALSLCGCQLLLAQPDNHSPFPVISLTISNSQFERLKDIDGTKLQLQDVQLLINQDQVKAEDIHSRGTSSLNFIRKSLSVDLDHPYAFQEGDTAIPIKKFDLLNLVMDKNLWHNRWAFLVLGELDLFPAFNTFCTLWINGQPQGVYLLVEKPNHAVERLKSPYMIRRASYHKIKHEYTNTQSKEEIRDYRERYHNLYRQLSRFSNQDLQQHIQSALLTTHYFNWLAFNYLIMNGEYADELYFYIDPSNGRFDIIPWDYDDIFARTPHEGNKARNSALANKLIFSVEDDLDRAIASDSVLYQSYCEAFKKLLVTMDNSFFERTLNTVQQELERLAIDGKSISASRYHDKEDFALDRARDDFRMSKVFLLNRRNGTLKTLEK